MVFGANGFIGSKLVKKLLLQQFLVIGYDYKAAPLLEDPNYTYIQGDFFNDTNFYDLLIQHKIDCIFHVIASSVPAEATQDTDKDISCNLLPSIRLLQAADKAGVKRLVFPSSGGTVYGEFSGSPNSEDQPTNPQCFYAAQKISIEAYLQLFSNITNLDCKIARISNPYGYCATDGRKQGIIPIFVDKLIKGEGITLFGETKRDYVYIDDAVEALILLSEYEGNESVFNIGSGKSILLSEVVREIEDVLGKKFPQIEKLEIRSCDIKVSELDVSKALHELHWKAKTPLKQGIEKLYQEMKTRQ